MQPNRDISTKIQSPDGYATLVYRLEVLQPEQ